MSFYYDEFLPICAKLGQSPSKVAQEIGCSKAMVSQWKNRGSAPSPFVKAKLDMYRGRMAEQQSCEQEQKKPPDHKAGRLSKDELEIISLYRSASPEIQAAMLTLLRSAEAGQSTPGDGGADK